MATPMRCRAHGRVSGDVCDHPGCFEPVEPDADVVETCPEPACGMPLPCPLHSRLARRDAAEAAAYLAANQRTPTPEASLRFPWGDVTLDGGELIIGRDHADRCGAQIEEFTNVSRLHAKVTLCDGALVIEDQGSTNGTTVNGRKIEQFAPEPLNDGDVVGFGAHLRAVVSTGRSGQ